MNHDEAVPPHTGSDVEVKRWKRMALQVLKYTGTSEESVGRVCNALEKSGAPAQVAAWIRFVTKPPTRTADEGARAQEARDALVMRLEEIGIRCAP